jgi:hypothetical protein
MWKAGTWTEIKTYTSKLHVSLITPEPLKLRSLDTLDLDIGTPGNECDMRSRSNLDLDVWSLDEIAL